MVHVREEDRLAIEFIEAMRRTSDVHGTLPYETSFYFKIQREDSNFNLKLIWINFGTK
jgi:hypothetical protein